ncbi:MAG: Calcipressin-domain-containing protein [Benniella sp.]|nr:MAG: Calcipressin-domain-containing protein [Benniella sp.]
MVEATSSPTVPTNTLTFTNLENHHFEQASFLANLRAQTETFGQLCFFSPIKSFHRVFVVYHSVFDAQRAKALLHNTRFQDTTLRVYFGQHTELNVDPEKYYLSLPGQIQASTDKSGLLSPPGSPPVGHVDEEELETVDDDFALEASPVSSVPSISSPAPSSTPSVPTLSLEGAKHKLRIDTFLAPSVGLAPRSPITPTRLAFSPSKESMGEQPFITIQDWGMDDCLSIETPRLSTPCH